MAIIDYPSGLGYGSLTLSEQIPRGPHVHRSVYTGTLHTSYGGHPRYVGVLVTPISAHDGSEHLGIVEMVESISDSRNQLRILRPTTDGTEHSIVVQPLRITPPQRDDRGVWSGWTIEFVESSGDVQDIPVT